MSGALPTIPKSTKWDAQKEVSPERWVCGYCNADVADDRGYATVASAAGTPLVIRCCPTCKLPTVFHPGQGWYAPTPAPGREVASVPPDLAALYREARSCAGVGAFTSAVLACRTILMHIAVDKGAKERDTFDSYIDFLQTKHYIPPEGAELARYIKTLGNSATHRIQLRDREDAEAAVMFVEALLRLIYELPGRIPAKVAAAAQAAAVNE